MTVGEQITARREELCMNKRELARLTGISQSNIARYENGSRNPSKKDSLLLENVLGINIADYKAKISKQKLGEKIDRLRIEHGFSKLGLAKKTFSSNGCVGSWISGKTLPSESSLDMLAEVFGITKESLLEGCIE